MKKFTFFLVFLILGTISVLSQEYYRLRFYNNSGGTAQGYLAANNNGVVQNQTSTTPTNYNTEWEFVPVGGNEPGWYYIRNVGYNCYLQAPAGNNTSSFNAQTNPTFTWRHKFRLVKVAPTTTPSNARSVGTYKLVAQNGNTRYVMARRSNSNNNYRIYESFTQDYSVVDIIATNDSWGLNVSQELTATYDNATAFPSNLPATDCYDFSGNDNSCYAEAYTNLFPAGYQRSANTTRVIHSFYASGNTEGDGLYFSRLPQNNTLSTQFRNPSVAAGNTLVIAGWIRARTSTSTPTTTKLTGTNFDAVMTSLLGTAPPTNLKDRLKIPEGYVVGKITTSTGSGNVGTIPITIPEIGSELNEPDGWYFYRMFYTLPSATGSNISATFTNMMAETDGLLDIDNINVSYINYKTEESDFKFLYKNGGAEGTPQNPHQSTQVIYARSGEAGYPDLVSAATKQFAYYRWHINEQMSREEYVDYFIPESENNMTAGYAGIVYTTATAATPNTKGILGVGHQMNILTPTWDDAGEWEYTNKEFIVSVDGSNYIDYNYNTQTGLTEPTLSWRNNFEFRPAWKIAKQIEDTLTAGGVLQYIELEAPADHRLRLTPQYAPTNYWITEKKNKDEIINGELHRGERFYWVPVEATDENNPSSNRDGDFSRAISANATYTFPKQTNNIKDDYQQYLQINTTGKAGTTEYYDVYVRTANSIDRKIARFKVTYSSKNEVGPITPPTDNQDLLSHIDRKKLITKLDFDQLGTPPANWETNRYNPLILGKDATPYSIGGFGAFQLSQDEGTYGFMNPRFHTYGTSTGYATGNGLHINAGCGFWSEYSFPQAINNGITGGSGYSGFGRGWSTNSNVWDRTSYNTGGTSTSPGSTIGNMMYADASEYPGTFVSLNIEESVCPGTVLYFSAWIVNLNDGSATSGAYENGSSNYLNASNAVTNVRPNLVFILKDRKTGAEIKRFYTGDIGMGAVGVWRQIAFSFVIPENIEGTESKIDFRLEIRNNGLGTTGNDFALDEICIYRTNPSVVATRVNATYCKETGEAVDTSPLDMEVEVDISNLEVYRTKYFGGGFINGYTDEDNHILYYRFLDSKGVTFPGDYKGFTKENGYQEEKDPEDIALIKDSMYYNMGLYRKDENTHFGDSAYYYYGAIDLNSLDSIDLNSEGKTIYEKDYSYTVDGIKYERTIRLEGDILTFHQDIPYSILFAKDSDEFNHGAYSIYVAETSGALLSPSCAGECDFVVGFDETDFTAYIESETDGVAPGELVICTNREVYVKAQSQDVNTKESLFAFYDWYYGPADTYPQAAFEYKYTPTNATEEQVIMTEDGYEYWLEDPNSGGPEWKTTEEGEAWLWAPVNYLGFNQRGGRFSYTGQYSTNKTGEEDIDAITGATKLDHDDNKDKDRFVEFRTLSQDLKAFRHYYPYAATVPAANVDCWPINPKSVGYVDPITGNLYEAKDGQLITDNCDKTVYDDSKRILGGYGEYDENTAYIEDIADLNRLLARLRYLIKKDVLYLHESNMPVDIQTLAPYFMTAIPTTTAFRYKLNANDEIIYDIIDGKQYPKLEWDNAVEICTTPAQVQLQAGEWGPDISFGEVNSNGNPILPYLEIDDEDYMYTVRLPERTQGDPVAKTSGELTATQFAIPMLYFDEIKGLRVKLTQINNAAGDSLVLGANANTVLNEAYIGLIDTVNTNKLLTDRYIWIDSEFNSETHTANKLDTLARMNLRWRLSDDRGPRRALEAYPLVYNSYNYFVANPFPDAVASLEGDPLPVGTALGTLGTSKGENYLNNVIENNNIGIEILASGLSELSAEYTTEVNGVQYFKPGLEYIFTMEGTGDEIWGASSVCDKSFQFRLRVVPDTVYWKGNTSDAEIEWNNDENWYASDLTTRAFAPLPETKVVLPSDLANYPTLVEYEVVPDTVDNKEGRMLVTFDLENETLKSSYTGTKYIEFDYNFLANSANEIYFKPGAELGRQDLLNYQTAKVDMQLKTFQWYTLSAPLRQLYSGDYTFERVNPLTEVQYHETQNAVNGTITSNWTRSFSNTNIEIDPGMGIALRIGRVYYPANAFTADEYEPVDASKNTTIANATLTFPGTKETFSFYDDITKVKQNYVESIPTDGRKFSSRFIYETTNNGISKVPTGDTLLLIPTNRIDSGKTVIVGNPLMAHIDFAEFYKVNKDIIKPAYQVLVNKQYLTLSGVDSDNDGVIEGSWTSTTGSDGVTLTPTSIPPMQSFIVTTKSEYAGTPPTLAITKGMGVVNTSSKLMRSSQNEWMPRLTISANRAGNSSSADVLLFETYKNAYHIDEDASLITIQGITSIPQIFTITENMYLVANRMNDLPKSLPIGILTGSKGKTSIKISGISSLNLNGDELYFKDVKENETILLNEDEFEYFFDNTAGNQIGRFYIIRETPDNTTNIEEDEISTISVYCKDKTVHVLSLDGELLKDVSIVGIDGRVIYKEIGVGTTYLQIPVSKLGATTLIVKANTDKAVTTTKILSY
ncbi:hypothetical protein LJB95_02280 [Paludibacteraceae bacterium OttesenSCG-928-F17]|nr:hypothetical protein [Paludibacteraceae bacterium OttesenSCG-928-F17]